MPSRFGSTHLFIYVTVLLVALSAGLANPIIPRLVQSIAGVGPSDAAYVLGLLTFVYAAAVFGTARSIGRLSDRFGRRRILLLALGAGMLDLVAAATTHSIVVLVLTRIIAGCCGGSIVVCNAYLADVTPADKRAERFGMLRSFLSAGIVLGPLAGGLLGTVDLRAPFWGGAIAMGIAALFAFIAIPESVDLRTQEPRAILWREIHPLAGFVGLKRLNVSMRMVLIVALFELGTLMVQPVLILFTQVRLGWSVSDVAFFLSVGAALGILAPAALTRVLVPRLGEPNAIVLGLGVFAVVTFLYGCVQQGWQLYALLVLLQVGLITMPALQAMNSSRVSGRELGELHGALVSVGSGVAMVGPLLGTTLFGYFSSSDAPVVISGATYFVASFFIALALLYALVERRSWMVTDAPAASSAH